MSLIDLKSVHIAKLAEDLGMSKTEVTEILQGNYPPRTLRFTTEDTAYVPERKQPVYVPPVKKVSIEEQIKEAEDVDDVWNILSTIPFDNPNYIPAYEKLIGFIKGIYENTDDKDELEELLDQTPSGSKEEKMILEKVLTLESNMIKEENDIDELISLYENENFGDVSKKLIIEKIISIANSVSETGEILDNQTFEEATWEYYAIKQKHLELIRKEISELNSLDDTSTINDNIPDGGSDEEVLLAQKIVSLCPDDPEALWNESSMFDSSSEAYEIIALGAIERSKDYNCDTLDEIISEFDHKSKVGRMAIKKKTDLTIKYANELTDASELEDIINEFDKDDLNRKTLEERLISLIDDHDELNDVINNNSGYIEHLAREKLNRLITELIPTASLDDLENFDDYVEDTSVEKDKIELRVVEICTSVDDADNITITHNSYAEYLFAKKFGQKVFDQVQPVVEPIVEEQVEEDNTDSILQKKIDQQEKNDIYACKTVKSAINMMYSLPEKSSNKEVAYERASRLLIEYLWSANDEIELKELLKLFPEETKEWISIVQKLSTFYPKPWYMFW
jgi:hypothetical protein